MNIYIVIPAHNEEDTISLTIDSIINQSLLPKKLIIVNDNSTDNTAGIVKAYEGKYSWITLVNHTSNDQHLPGSKIIEAFYKGFELLDDAYDVICKFDADLIFPQNYLERISNRYNNDQRLGMVSGFCYIEKDSNWVLENLTGKDHIRGALKSYRKECFLEIGKLKKAMGWDTIDELLAQFYGWEIFTDETLKVKHLKPTGSSYNKAAKHLQGEAMYKIRNGLLLTSISALKMGIKKKSFSYFKDYIAGYLKASRSNSEFLVTEEQGKFIRNFRWQAIRKKVM